jgi:HK97 gp10 family phage protein
MSVEFRKVKGLDKIIDKSIDVGILETCIKITAEAKSAAPLDKGRLRNSIMYKTTSKDGGFNNDSSREKADRQLEIQPKKLEGYVGANLEYAIYQEYGTRKMAPQPFLRPAGLIVKSGNQADVIRRIDEEVKRGVLQAGQTRETFR